MFDDDEELVRLRHAGAGHRRCDSLGRHTDTPRPPTTLATDGMGRAGGDGDRVFAATRMVTLAEDVVTPGVMFLTYDPRHGLKDCVPSARRPPQSAKPSVIYGVLFYCV
jgi:hypothetical protein